MANLRRRLNSLFHEICRKHGQTIQQGFPSCWKWKKYNRVSHAFDVNAVAAKAKFLGESNGLTVAILKEFCCFHRFSFISYHRQSMDCKVSRLCSRSQDAKRRTPTCLPVYVCTCILLHYLFRSITPHHLFRHHLRGDLLDQLSICTSRNRDLPCV